MSAARTASRLLRLYPRSWRTRYGEELQALIVDMSPGPRVPWRLRADVAGAGAGEWLRSLGLGGGELSPRDRARGGASLVLWAWALFIVGGVIVQKTSEHWQDVLPSGHHGIAKLAFAALVAVAVVGALLVLTGIALALPALLRHLRAGGWSEIRRPIRVAAALTVVFVVAMTAVLIWAHGLTPRQRTGDDTAYAIGVVAWALLGAVMLAAWTAAATRTVARLELTAATLRLEVRLARLVSATMTVMAGATAVWWVAVASLSPSALVGSLGHHGSALVPGLVLAMGLMLLATALGAAGASRATRALAAIR